MTENKVLYFVGLFFVGFAVIAFGSPAQAQSCMDFKDYPTTVDYAMVTELPSPVSPPPGESFLANVNLYYVVDEDDRDPNSSQNDDAYFFSEHSITYDEWDPNGGPNGDGAMVIADRDATALAYQYYGYLDITFTAPISFGMLVFDMIHYNQPEVEYRIWDWNGIELTSGWEQSNMFPDFVQGTPTTTDPIEEHLFSIVVSNYFNPARPIGRVWVRNLSGKNFFFKICV